MRVLTQPPQSGGHPLAALSPNVARPSPPAPAWARISHHVDPVYARWISACVFGVGVWQWMPVPATCAHVVLESGALRLLVGLVTLGGAHAGRCALCAARPHA